MEWVILYHWIRRKLFPRSLGGQLLKKITLILLVITLLSTVSTYFIVRGKVRQTYDRLLAQTARVYEVVITKNIKYLHNKNSKQSLQALWQEYYDIGSYDINGHKIHNDEKNAGFQLLATDGRLLVPAASTETSLLQ